MAFHAPSRLSNQEDAGEPDFVCRVCGHRTFSEDTPHEFAGGLSDRLLCQACGAHYQI